MEGVPVANFSNRSIPCYALGKARTRFLEERKRLVPFLKRWILLTKKTLKWRTTHVHSNCSTPGLSKLVITLFFLFPPLDEDRPTSRGIRYRLLTSERAASNSTTCPIRNYHGIDYPIWFGKGVNLSSSRQRECDLSVPRKWGDSPVIFLVVPDHHPISRVNSCDSRGVVFVSHIEWKGSQVHLWLNFRLNICFPSSFASMPALRI